MLARSESQPVAHWAPLGTSESDSCPGQLLGISLGPDSREQGCSGTGLFPDQLPPSCREIFSEDRLSLTASWVWLCFHMNILACVFYVFFFF